MVRIADAAFWFHVRSKLASPMPLLDNIPVELVLKIWTGASLEDILNVTCVRNSTILSSEH